MQMNDSQGVRCWGPSVECAEGAPRMDAEWASRRALPDPSHYLREPQPGWLGACSGAFSLVAEEHRGTHLVDVKA